MREIKFRCWNIKEKRWQPFQIWEEADANGTSSEDGTYELFSDEFFTWQQYTRLKDIHGVEIYEGDILSSPSMPNSPVEFQRGSFNAVYADGSHDEWEAPLWRYSVEVIGNIYENPELLEANQ